MSSIARPTESRARSLGLSDHARVKLSFGRALPVREPRKSLP